MYVLCMSYSYSTAILSFKILVTTCLWLATPRSSTTNTVLNYKLYTRHVLKLHGGTQRYNIYIGIRTLKGTHEKPCIPVHFLTL